MKRLKQWIAALCMTVSMTMTAFGGQWMQDTAGWWYQNDDGSYPVSCWQWIDGNQDGLAECYYFDANGYCLMNGQTPDGNFVNADGALVLGGMVQTQAVNAGAANGNSSRENTPDAGINSWQKTSTVMPGSAQNVRVETGNAQNTGIAAGNSSGYMAEAAVWLSATGEKYHRIPNCGRMNPSKARQVSLDEAVAGGYQRCKNCF